MANKVFRIYQGGAKTYQDWNKSNAFPYDSTNRQTITDPNGGNAHKQITSIPSPFARIALTKTAFAEVVKSGNLDGTTIYHRMVSDAWDVGEIFFNMDKLGKMVRIIRWDPVNDLQALHDGDEGHECLADSMEKYMDPAYNLNKMQGIYLLDYQGPGMPSPMNIIGATSPSTLFFSSANDLSYVTGNIVFSNNDKPFDFNLQPLYKRDIAFVKYIWALSMAIPNFAGLFPEVAKYLQLAFQQLGNADKKTLSALNANYLVNDLSLAPLSTGPNNVEVLGQQLYKVIPFMDPASNDFVLRPSKAMGHAPLVLPVENGNKYQSFKYMGGQWGKDNKAPYFDKTPLEARCLPFNGMAYPYLTISDFLEDNIIEVPYELNRERFFDGHCNKPGHSFLIPLKPLYFKYFSTADLTGTMTDGKPAFEMRELSGGGVDVTLRIPVAGQGQLDYVEYKRMYHQALSADMANNQGGIHKFDFSGFVMPCVKFDKPEEAIYNVTLAEDVNSRGSFAFYQDDKPVSVAEPTRRNDTNMQFRTGLNYILEGSNFDTIQVRDAGIYAGLVVPLFMPKQSINEFEFAIDLGTSNTHIEFKKKGEKTSRELGFHDDEILCRMFIPQRDKDGNQMNLIDDTHLFERDYLPGAMDAVSDFHFPSRTVLSSKKGFAWTNTAVPFTLVNMALTFGKRKENPWNEYYTNVKWGERKKIDREKFHAFAACVMMLIRNKVVANNGNLDATRVTWFYPSSMSSHLLGRMTDEWDNLYADYINKAGHTVRITESAAPLPFIFDSYSTASKLINIDIGGGTTDVVYASNRAIDFITSFRFAANDLFQDAYALSNSKNGIIDFYKDSIRDCLAQSNVNGMGEIINLFDIDSNMRPANMASFLFGLKDNSIVASSGLSADSYDLNTLLCHDNDFRVVFLLFYSAIIYHVAQIIRLKGLEEPRHISFSGNGSKVIKILTSDMRLLADYTKKLFEAVLGHPYNSNGLDIIGFQKGAEPKKATCKGGIQANADSGCSDKVCVLRGDGTALADKATDTFLNVDKTAIVNETRHFFDFILNDMGKRLDFNDLFGIGHDAVGMAMKSTTHDLDTYLNNGLANLKQEGLQDTDPIEETTFFMPIKGVLNDLSEAIKNKKEQQNLK